MQPRFLLVGLLLAALIILGLQYGGPLLERLSAPSSAASPAASEPEPRPERVQAPLAEPAVPVPRPPNAPAAVVEPRLPPPEGLDAADPWLREHLPGALDAWSEDMDWLRLLGAVLDNARRGEYPRNLLGFLAPRGRFAVVAEGERFRVDPASYARYDGLVDALYSVTPAQAADAFVALEPLIGQALGELGTHDVEPRALLLAAIAQVEALPADAFEAPLVRPKVMYRYADRELEALSPLAKQLLRFGPDNVARLRAWASAVRLALTG
ncbi:MAG: DUF3014 domain-containing protein [Pseudomonadota bacterium]